MICDLCIHQYNNDCALTGRIPIGANPPSTTCHWYVAVKKNLIDACDFCGEEIPMTVTRCPRCHQCVKNC